MYHHSHKKIFSTLLILVALFSIFGFSLKSEAAVAFRSASQTVGGTASTIVINKPTGVVSGDVLVAGISFRPNTLTVTPPAGWTLVNRQDNTNTTANSLAVYWLAAGASEPANYTWTFSAGSTGSAGGISAFSGVDTVNAINISGGTTSGATVSLSVSAPSVTTTVANTMLVTSHADSNANTWTPPSGMTQAVSVASVTTPNDVGESVEMNYLAVASAGATGIKTATAVGVTADVSEGIAIALAPVPSGTITSAQSGNWNSPSTWVGGVVPTASNNVIIDGGDTVTINVANAAALSLTIGSGSNSTGVILFNSGSVLTVSSTLTLGGNGQRKGSINMTSGGTLNLGAGVTVNNAGTWTPGTGTVVYNSTGSQTVDVTFFTSYNNLILDGGSGAKSIVAGTSITGNLSIAPTGTATANIGAGLNISVGSLTVGGLGTVNGTWGSTSSTATNKNNTYFTATTGIVTVTTNTRLTQAALIITSITGIFPASVSLTTSGGSGTGAVSYVASNGTATGCSAVGSTLSFTSAGTCIVTATKAADTNYNSVSSTPTTVTISKGTQAALTFTGQTVSYPTTFAALSTTGGSGTGAVTYAVTTAGTAGCSIAGTTLSYTSVGTCGVTATKATDTNYNAASSAEATFTVNTSAFTLTYTAGANGSIVGTTPQTVNSGASGTLVTATPNPGYYFTSWSDGVLTASRTDTNVLANISVTANFALIVLTLDHFTIATVSTETASTAFDIVVTAKDSSDNVLTSFNGSVDITLNSGTIAPTTSGLFVGGVITQSVTIPTVGSNKIITVTDHAGSGKTGTSNTFTVSAGAIDHFVIDTIPSESEGTPFSITMTAKDINGNTVTDFVGTVNLTTNSASISPTTSGSFVGGIRTESVTLTGSGTGKTITATRTGGTETATSNSFSLGSAAVKFVIFNPLDNTVGNNVTVTIQAQDASNNLVNTYNSGVTLITSGGATGSGLVSIVNGIGTKIISDTIAETVNLTLSDTQSTGLDVSSTQDVIFIPGSLHHFVISNIASPQVAGSDIGTTITAKDSFGNTVTSFTGTVDFSTTAGTITPSISGNFVLGVLTQNTKVTQSGGGETISVIRSGGSETGTSNSFTVNPGATAKFTLNHPGSITTGTRAGYTVTREDQFNNLVTSGLDTVYLTTSSGLTSKFYDAATIGNEITSIDITNTHSSANFWYFDDNIGSWVITASDSTPANGATGIADATDSITVSATPIVATRFVILDHASATAGDTVSIIVQAQDGFGNIDTTYNNTVTLHATSPSTSVSAGGIVTISNGVGTINIVDTKAEIANLSLQDTASTLLDVSSSKSLTFTPGVFDHFIMDPISSPVVAGANIGLTVKAYDVNGNVATSFNGTVDFTTTAGIITPLTSSNFISGVLTQNVSVSQVGTSKTITVTKTSDVQSYISNTFDVNPGNAASFIVEANGGGSITTKTIGIPFDLKITAKDAFGNIATSFNGTVNITSTGTLSVGGGASSSFVSGILSPYSVTISNIGIFTITATRSGGSETGTSNSFSVTSAPIVATKFHIITPSDVQVGQSTIVTVEAVDNSGNREDTYQGSVKGNVVLVTSGSATGAGIVTIVNGVGSKTIADNTVETVNLSLAADVPASTLDISSTSNIIFSATPPVSRGGIGIVTFHGGTPAAPIVPTISFTGRAFPQASLEIMAIRGAQIPITSNTQGASTGNFDVSYTGILPADVNNFALVLYDKDKKIVQTKLFTLGVNDQVSQTILMAPTVNLNQPTINKGAFMGIVGSAMPNYKVELTVDGIKATENATAAADGNYSILINTYHLALGDHALRVRQVDNQGKTSDYSIERTFIVTKSFIPKADLNHDGKIDATDLSIFMARYHLPDVQKHTELDLNGDGKVDIQDLSLLLGALTK